MTTPRRNQTLTSCLRLLLALFIACIATGPQATRAQLLPTKLLQNLDKFQVLLGLLTYTDLYSTILFSNGVTTFAPTDAAFRQSAIELGGCVITDKASVVQCYKDKFTVSQLRTVIRYHVVRGQYKMSALRNDAPKTYTSLSGRPFATSKLRNNKIVLVDLTMGVSNPTIISPQLSDITYQSNVVHAVNRVLLPLRNYYQSSKPCRLVSSPVVLANERFMPLPRVRSAVRKCQAVRKAVNNCARTKVLCNAPVAKQVLAPGITLAKAIAAATSCRFTANALVACKI